MFVYILIVKIDKVMKKALNFNRYKGMKILNYQFGLVLMACLFGFSQMQVQANVTEWEINGDGVLKIHLDGDMENFNETSLRPPWFNERANIKEVVFVLTSLDKKTSIGSYAFADCSNLTKITIPDNTTSIREYAFSGCSSLTDITFPENVTSIGRRVFLFCDKMKSVTSLNPNPPSTNSQSVISSDAFYSGMAADPYQNAHMDLYIPAGSLAAYNSTGSWKNFETKTVLATKITLNIYKINVDLNESYTLHAVMPTDVTDKAVVWRSSNADIATVNNGVVTGKKNGRISVTVTTSYGVTASCVVTVGPILVDSINFYNPAIALPVGATSKLRYYVLPSDAANQEVEWSSSKDDIAGVDDEGVVTARLEGEVDIIATSKDGSEVTAICKVTVYIPVDSVSLPNSISLVYGTSEVLNYQIYPLNASNKSVTWTSHNPEVATVTDGRVNAIDTGEVNITVTTVDGHKTATCQVRVMSVPAASVDIEGKSILRVGDITTLKATVLPETVFDKSVKWSSSNENVATVDDDGEVAAVNLGEANIIAVSADGTKSDTFKVRVVIPVQHVTILVSFSEDLLHPGESYTLGYKIGPEDATIKDVTWSSSDPTVLTVDNEGVVYAKRGGNSTITVTSVEGNKTSALHVRVIGRDAALKNITVLNQELLQEFDKNTFEYEVVIDHSIDSITIMVETSDQDAVVDGTGTKYNLAVGDTSFIINVMSNDRTDTCEYKLNVTRLGSGDATLKELTTDEGTLTPVFDPYTFNYTDTVPNSITEITILFKKNHEKAAIISDALVAKKLIVGDNVFTINVMAENTNIISTYTVNIRRLSNDAMLSELTVSEGTLSSVFNPVIFDYTDTVYTPTITIVPKANYDAATVSITEPDVRLFQDNIFTINVISEDKTVNNTYTVNVVYIPGGFCGYDLMWSISKEVDKLAIKGSGEMFEYPVTVFPWYFYSTSIKSIVISEGVTGIGNFAFGMCENLSLVTNMSSEPQIIRDKSVFGSLILSNLTLCVPAGSAEKYAVADVWKEFGTRLELRSTGISQVDASPVQVYLNNQNLYIDSPVSERIDIYSITGKLLHRLEKSAGKTSFTGASTSSATGQVLIVRGSSGWVKKLVQ
jgi:uncharacterized protein YjdB